MDAHCSVWDPEPAQLLLDMKTTFSLVGGVAALLAAAASAENVGWDKYFVENPQEGAS